MVNEGHPLMDIQPDNCPKRSADQPRRLPLRLAFRVSLGLGVALTGGCDKAGAAKSGGAEPAKGGEVGETNAGHGGGEAGGHAHAHAHGEHADEVKLTPEAIQANGVRVAVAEKKVLV